MVKFTAMYYWRKITTPYNLEQAWREVRRRKGAAGLDGITIRTFHADWEFYLLSLQELLLAERYVPHRLRQKLVPKRDGSTRVIQIPSVLDRVVGRAVLNIIAPDLELTFSPSNYAYRRGKSVREAVRDAWTSISKGATWAVRVDISNFFGSVEHKRLLGCIDELYVDTYLKRLLQTFVNNHSACEGEVSRIGIAQGSILSPLFANIYLDAFDKRFQEAQVFRYADDILLLTRTKTEALSGLSTIQDTLSGIGLKLNERKTKIANVPDGICFLGFYLTARGIAIPREVLETFRSVLQRLSKSANSDRCVKMQSYAAGWTQHYRSVVGTKKMRGASAILRAALRNANRT